MPPQFQRLGDFDESSRPTGHGEGVGATFLGDAVGVAAVHRAGGVNMSETGRRNHGCQPAWAGIDCAPAWTSRRGGDGVGVDRVQPDGEPIPERPWRPELERERASASTSHALVKPVP